MDLAAEAQARGDADAALSDDIAAEAATARAAEEANASAIAGEAARAQEEEGKLSADMVALHDRHMSGEFPQVASGAFVVTAADMPEMGHVHDVFVNGLRQVRDTDFSVTMVDGLMTEISFAFDMQAGDHVSVTGMKKVDLLS